jgi:hypothetical protein
LTDGGLGDDDGVPNGVIVDPSGLGTLPSTDVDSDTTIGGDGGGGGGGCLVATATYGSPIEPHVKVLREFRDRFLLTNSAGKSLVRFYYTYSAPVAEFIGRHDTVRALVRWSLLPMVGVSWIALQFGPWVTLALLVLLICLMGAGAAIVARRIRLRQYP